MKIDGECLIEWIGSCRNKVQVVRSIRMPQLHTLLHFHLATIVMINGSSRLDLIFRIPVMSLHPRRGREPVAVSAVLSTALGKQFPSHKPFFFFSCSKVILFSSVEAKRRVTESREGSIPSYLS